MARVDREQLHRRGKVIASCGDDEFPPPPCLTRFVASSVATRATLPFVSASNRSAVAHPTAARLASATWLPSWTMTDCGCHAHRAIITRVPWPGSDSTENSLHSRFDPPSPRPSPPPVVNPSVKARSMSGIPGPWSWKTSRKPFFEPSCSVTISTCPPRPCVKRVARELAGRSHELGLVDQAEPQHDGQLAHALANDHDVVATADRERFRRRRRHSGRPDQ